MQALTLSASRLLAPQTARLPARRATVRAAPVRPVVASSVAVSLPKSVSDAELPAWLTLAGFVAIKGAEAAKLGSFNLTASLVYQSLAAYTLASAVLAVLGRGQGGEVATIVGPGFLAANALDFFNGRVSAFGAASFAFGYLWIDQLPSFSYSRWVWLATLAGAVYQNMGAQWLVAAFGLSALWKLVGAIKDGGAVQLQNVGFLALAGWALYKKVEEPVALLMMLSSVVTAVLAAIPSS